MTNWRDIAFLKFAAGHQLWIDKPREHAEWRKNGLTAGIPYPMALRIDEAMGEEYQDQIVYVGIGFRRKRYPQTIKIDGMALQIERVPKVQAENEARRREGKWSELSEHLNALPNGEALRIPLSDKRDLSSLRSYIYGNHPKQFWVRSSGTVALIWRRDK